MKIKTSILGDPGRHCGRGKILRKGYTTKRGVHVAASCVIDQGAPGKGKKILPQPKEGHLKGWRHDMAPSTRHKIVSLIARKEGCGTALKRLNLLANFTKRTSPGTHKKARADAHWLKRQKSCKLKTK